MKLWYNTPGEEFLDSIPVGNGRMGATTNGGIVKDTIFLNEDSIWYGGFRNRVNPDSKAYHKKLQDLVFQGKVWEAEKTAFLSHTSTPEGERTYQPLGTLDFTYYYPQEGCASFFHDAYVQDEKNIIHSQYSRTLELGTATATVQYTVDDISYTREMFASYPDDIMAIKLTSSKEKSISFSMKLSRDKWFDTCDRLDNHMILLNGTLGGDGANEYSFGVSASALDGTVEVIGQHLVVQNATQVVLYIYANTKFYNDNYKTLVKEKLQTYDFHNYDQLYNNHLKDFQEIYNRVTFSLFEDTNPQYAALASLPTNLRLDRMKQGETDLGMQVLLYHYGRYLLITSSREGSLPMNLRGIWNHEYRPPWDGKFTININQEMLYWPVDMCNMSECGEPMYHLIERMQANGQKVAEEMYGCRGFVAHHNTDLWADCAPQDIHRAALWALGAAWLVLHLWDTYDYNRNPEVLKTYYPIIEDAARFVLDYLVEDPEGYLATCPSHSPENGYYPDGRKDIRPALTYGPTMDNMIISYLFRRVEEASAILGLETPVTQEIQVAKHRIRPSTIGSDGRLMEWVKEFDEPDPGHRHMAHLFGLHPADDITMFKTPDLAHATMKSVEKRLAHLSKADIKNGWTVSWYMLFEGRLLRSENAYHYLEFMFKHALANNLFGLCVTEEIYVLDGNLGILTAMTELLVQSQSNELFLLPCLPKQWDKGILKGIKGRGGYEIDLEWSENQLVKGTIYSKVNTTCHIRIPKSQKTYTIYESTKEGSILCNTTQETQLETTLFTLEVEANKTYIIM